MKIQFSIGFGRAKSQDSTEARNYFEENMNLANGLVPLRKKVDFNICKTARRFDEMRKDAIAAEISAFFS